MNGERCDFYFALAGPDESSSKSSGIRLVDAIFDTSVVFFASSPLRCANGAYLSLFLPSVVLVCRIEIGMVTGHAQRLLETLGGRNRPARPHRCSQRSLAADPTLSSAHQRLRFAGWLRSPLAHAGRPHLSQPAEMWIVVHFVDGGCVGWMAGKLRAAASSSTRPRAIGS